MSTVFLVCTISTSDLTTDTIAVSCEIVVKPVIKSLSRIVVITLI